MSAIRQLEVVKNPQETPNLAREEVDVILKTDGNSGQTPIDYSISAERLLVSGKGELNKPRIVSDLRVIRGSMPESIIGRDDRTKVIDSENRPWRMICSLKINGRVGGAIGTGFFVAPKIIITAGHCVFHPNLGGWAKEIIISPGRFESEHPFPKNPAYQKPIVSHRFITVKGWTEDQNPDFDYAAIYIDDPIGNETGWFSMAVLDNDALKGRLVNIAGYPGDRDFGRNQYFCADKIDKVQSNRFFYTADSYGGQSGGPCWFQDDNNQPIVIGIHSYGVGGDFTLNSATRITAENFKVLKGWIDAGS